MIISPKRWKWEWINLRLHSETNGKLKVDLSTAISSVDSYHDATYEKDEKRKTSWFGTNHFELNGKW